MTTKAFTILVDTSILPGITAARLAFNKQQPPMLPGVGPGAAPVPNPMLSPTDEDFVQQRWGKEAAQAYFDAMQGAFRIPSGAWLQRWTADERKTARAIGAGKVADIDAATADQVQGWLDQLDASQFVNLTDAVVTSGVPTMCTLLEQLGVIPAGQADARAAAIMAQEV